MELPAAKKRLSLEWFQRSKALWVVPNIKEHSSCWVVLSGIHKQLPAHIGPPFWTHRTEVGRSSKQTTSGARFLGSMLIWWVFITTCGFPAPGPDPSQEAIRICLRLDPGSPFALRSSEENGSPSLKSARIPNSFPPPFPQFC